MENLNIKANIKENKVLLDTFFDSPRELVFEAFSTPEHVSQWWGPDGFTLTTQKMEFRSGGTWTFIMHGPDGKDYFNKVFFIEIKNPELILYKHIGDSEETENINFQTRILFEKEKDGTRLKITMEFPSREELDYVAKNYGAIEGAEQHLSNLCKYIDKIKKDKLK